jgi:NAD(P)-dependent dehydrogenase (short-subunit alcohol dehydrogenase family)
MAEIYFSESMAGLLRGKVVVITGMKAKSICTAAFRYNTLLIYKESIGGADGIGAATVGTLHSFGAHVYFGDCNDGKGKELEQVLLAKDDLAGGSANFQHLDVRDYHAQLSLFRRAFQDHGHVDVAISCAAVKEPGSYFEPETLNLETVLEVYILSAINDLLDSNRNSYLKEPTELKSSIDINLTSVLYFSRIALAHMKASSNTVDDGDKFSKSIILVSSIAGITEAPGLFAYSSAKHGVIGLMRALRPWAPSKYDVRANAICPWATDTQLLKGVRDVWIKEKMPMNSPEDVARIIIQCAADSSLNGKAVFVTGGRAFDTEEGVERTLPQWMGEQNAIEFQRGQKILGLVCIKDLLQKYCFGQLC